MKKLALYLVLSLASLTAWAQQGGKYQLSSHILDITQGVPASGVTVQLEKQDVTTLEWKIIDEKTTDENGRIKDFLPVTSGNNNGNYRLRFMVDEYFKQEQTESFYPYIEVVFRIQDDKHYHVPITLSPYGHSTYRGS
ncbi:hydroxyisourate hydrolase [Porphyromonas pogonae]|uniref:hydroxyisourate hydrolase n=1 Tax=Porphyromonas pogonae TaxID=867595 RepID=UPI002E75FCA4|nr:hydroxyisourate hydrolase [Porphyromonas pogonae]